MTDPFVLSPYPAPPPVPREERPRAVRMSEALLVGVGLNRPGVSGGSSP